MIETTISEHIFNQGLAQGKAEGKQEGKMEGLEHRSYAVEDIEV